MLKVLDTSLEETTLAIITAIHDLIMDDGILELREIASAVGSLTTIEIV